MTDWSVSFIVKGGSLEKVLEAIHHYKVEGLEFKPLFTKGTKGKASGKPAWQAVVECVHAAKGAITSKEVANYLEQHNYKRSGVSVNLRIAQKKKLIRKTKSGYIKV